MKHVTISALLLAFATTLFAQVQETSIKKFYMDLGTGPVSRNGLLGEIGATAVLNNNWMFSISYSYLDVNPKNLPSDYEQGFNILPPIKDPMPSANLKMFNFIGGKFFPLGRKTWVTTLAGLSVGSGDKVSFTPQRAEMDGLYFTSNYSVQNKSQMAIGGTLKSDFNWAFTPYVGLGVGAFAHVNSIQSAVGAEIKLIFGWLNTKKSKKA